MYYPMFRQFRKTLGQLGTWLDKAAAHAKEQGVDPSGYLALRLAPDQFAFARQVQTACDTAKLAAGRLTGKEMPAHADDEKTLDDLAVRVKSMMAILDALTEADFASAATRVVS